MFVEHKEAGEVTEAPAKITKLSEAIRIGAKARHQCQTYFYANGGSCALGAAIEAVYGYPGDGEPPRAMSFHFMESFGVPSHMRNQIADRNDSGATREEIADWLEAQGY